MPPSTKHAPPQQASLSELWKKGVAQKQPRSFGAASANGTLAEPNAMDVEGAEAMSSSQTAPTTVTAGALSMLCATLFY